MLPLLWVLVGVAAEQTGDGPTDPPRELSYYTYSGGKIHLDWVNGDETAYTRCYRHLDTTPELMQTLDPGNVGWDTGAASLYIGVSHFKNGIETDIVGLLA